MRSSARLKPAHKGILIFTLVVIAILVSTWAIFGESAFCVLLAALMAGMAFLHLFFLLRTRNPVYWIPMLFYGFTAAIFATSPSSNRLMTLFLAAGAVLFFVLLIVVLFTRKIKWRYTEVLELAARPVEGADDGFTSRPYPAGEAAYKREEISGFAAFLLRHVIAFPYCEEDRVVLVIPPSMLWHILGLKRDYRKSTYVSFAMNGGVSVNIAKRDYQNYREELTFNKLCQELGDLFKEFLALYKKGEAGKIIDRLNALRLFV